MLEIDKLTFTYPHRKQPVFSDLSLQINQGGIYGLLGPNGAGKSTLLYLIAGLLNAKSGTVSLFGQNTRLRKPSTLSQLFLVPEEFTLPNLSMSQYADIYSKYYPNFSMEELKANLQVFGFDTDLPLAQLSMGQKKKAFMSFALAANTPLLIMDEPTNGLDIPGKLSFRSFIASNMNPDRAIIISTHQVNDVSALLDHVIIMDNNQILLNASIGHIASRLKFEISNDPVAIANALYRMPTVQGISIVSINDTNQETQVDLVLLFQLLTENPQTITLLQ